jgi:tellurite resistance protein TerC
MVFGPNIHLNELAAYGGSAMLRAEDIYREHAPSQAVLQTFLFRLWTGEDPAHHEHDPANHLPEHGIKGLEPQHDHHERKTVLFDEDDLVPWVVFTFVFFILVIFDNAVLHRKAEKLTLLKSLLYTTFWIAVAGMFNLYIYWTRGLDDAFSWGTGYLLEWMLSVDNLFVFHRIFVVFKTPDEQKHKPLFYGIIGAIVFRMVFFLIEEILLHHVTWMHIVFGLFLIYTGFKAVTMDDDDEAPDQGWLYQMILSRINYVDEYDEKGRFFMPIAVDKETGQPVEDIDSARLADGKPLDDKVIVQYRATRLTLVVVCLEVTDLIFAVDSVSAIVAQIPDLFLAYTACVFAMLGLRAMFFAIDELVKMFTLLSYGVAFILIFLGLKLILRSWIHIPPGIVCSILVSTLALSVLLSMLQDKFGEKDEAPEDTESQSARAAN